MGSYSSKQCLNDLKFISYNMGTESSYKKIKEIFSKVDKNGNGTLDKKELKKYITIFLNSEQNKIKKVFLQSYYTDEDIENMFKECDANGSNDIDEKEFRTIIGHLLETQMKLKDAEYEEIIPNKEK